ncbi:hypothetical protein B0H13DRAFT_1899836 [Mycena leptocephala]|nr:hypothetical protein B0H13DRAFT_1899836 [Mycena leptocephala]
MFHLADIKRRLEPAKHHLIWAGNVVERNHSIGKRKRQEKTEMDITGQCQSGGGVGQFSTRRGSFFYNPNPAPLAHLLSIRHQGRDGGRKGGSKTQGLQTRALPARPNFLVLGAFRAPQYARTPAVPPAVHVRNCEAEYEIGIAVLSPTQYSLGKLCRRLLSPSSCANVNAHQRKNTQWVSQRSHWSGRSPRRSGRSLGRWTRLRHLWWCWGPPVLALVLVLEGEGENPNGGEVQVDEDEEPASALGHGGQEARATTDGETKAATRNGTGYIAPEPEPESDPGPGRPDMDHPSSIDGIHGHPTSSSHASQVFKWALRGVTFMGAVSVHSFQAGFVGAGLWCSCGLWFLLIATRTYSISSIERQSGGTRRGTL